MMEISRINGLKVLGVLKKLDLYGIQDGYMVGVFAN